MSLAPTNIRGAFLNWRFAVKGIQNAFRSFGTVLRSSAIGSVSQSRDPNWDSRQMNDCLTKWSMTG